MAAKDRPQRRTLSSLRTGLLIREARQHARLTQTELAARLRTTQSAVSNWERGLDVPRVDTLARILDACGFEADLTFRRQDDEDRSLIAMHLDMTPEERLDALDGLLEFEEIAHGARRVPAA
jgi:transcriptional regulator with XRE-family HTH domain